MPSDELQSLRKRLLRSGIAPRFVDRAVSELHDHFEDIENEACARGDSDNEAAVQAIERIGAIESIVNSYSGKPELKCWMYRYPRMARVILPVAYVVASPVALVNSGARYAPFVARWCACLLLGALVTATMLLLMQMTIAFA